MPEILSLIWMKGYSNFITHHLSSTAITTGIAEDVNHSRLQKCVRIVRFFGLGSQNLSTALYKAIACSVKRFQRLKLLSADYMLNLTSQQVWHHLGDY